MPSTIESSVAKLLTDKSLTLSAAESCTGGLLGDRLTNISGSSSFFVGTFVAYAYEAKEKLLGITSKALLTHGAVSEEIAIQMALGARSLFNTDYALGITGIAGPGGGTPEKPVGLVYIGLVSKNKTICQKHLWQGSRQANKIQSVQAALTLLEETILAEYREIK